MKLTDRLAACLIELGLERAYGLQGGSVAHVIDSYVRHGGVVTYQHHEEHSILAATGDCLSSGRPGLAFVSTGPAGTNAITGLLGAWQDSLPLMVISGQARSSEMSYDTPLRQIGSQEAPILDIVRRITKRSILFTEDLDVKHCLSDLYDAATSGRPGPVWLDIPIDLQLSEEK